VTLAHRTGDETPTDWDGPEWAAPAEAVRLTSRPVIEDDTYGTALLRLLSYGQIDANEFQRLRQAARAYHRESQA
jgi:hypothetical protein